MRACLPACVVPVALTLACVAAPGAEEPLSCPAPGALPRGSMVRNAGADAQVNATLFVFRGDCPAPRPGPVVDGLLGRGLAEHDEASLLGTEEAVVTGDELQLELGIPLREQLVPPWSYCARLVFWARSDTLDQRAVPTGKADGRYAVWPRQAFQARLAHQDSATFRVRPYQPVCLRFGDLQGTGADADLALYDDDNDRVPNLVELQLGLRPAEVDSMASPAPDAEVFLDTASYAFGSAATDALSNETDGTTGTNRAVNVNVPAFTMDTTEVTNRQYRVCMGTVVDGADGPRFACDKPRVSEVFSAGEQKLAGPTFDAHPVVGVTHGEAEAFCRQRGMRLPTEVEWERAARLVGAELRDNSFSGMLPVDVNECDQGRFYTQAAGGSLLGCSDSAVMDTGAVVRFKDGALQTARILALANNGIVDLAGNVAEWTHDHYAPALHEHIAANPGETSLPSSGSRFTVRGGSFRSGPRFVLGYARAGVDDAASNVESTLLAVGFRCVR